MESYSLPNYRLLPPNQTNTARTAHHRINGLGRETINPGFSTRLHNFIGPAVGIIFGALAAASGNYPNLSRKNRVTAAVIFIEILSQPLLASFPILVDWKAFVPFTRYGISFFMHLILGLILGIFVSKGIPVVDP